MTNLPLRAFLPALLLLLGSGGVRAQDAPPLDPTKAITQYHLDTWTTGLPQNTIDAVTQTPDGYLWLGTQEGLVRFDGLRFHVYDKRNSALRSNSITALYVDRSGRLWVGTRGGGLSRREGGGFVTYTTADGLSSTEISAILEDRSGSLWIGTFDAGLNRFRDGQFSRLDARHGLTSNKVITLAEDAGGALWIGTLDAGLSRYEDGQFTPFTTDNGLSSDAIAKLYASSDGSLWIGMRGDGLVRYADGRFLTYTPEDGLPSGTIYAFHEDAAGSLWIGTQHGGLSRFRGGTFSTLSARDGLTHDVVKALYEDREGSLWIGTENGLTRLQNGKFTTYTTKEGLAHNYVFSVYGDGRGTLWVGTEGGGISRLRDDTFTTYTSEDGLSSDIVLSVGGTRDGSIWAGTPKGLNRLRHERFTTYTVEEGLPGNVIYATYEDGQGALWIGTNGGLARFRSGTFTSYTTADGLSSNRVTALTEDAAGSLWVGTFDGGLNQLRDGRVVATYDGAQHESLADYVVTLFADRDGVLWFSTREAGLHRLEDGRLTTYTTRDGLVSDKIFQILEDDDGNLWMSCNKGLFRVSKAQLNAIAEGQSQGPIAAVSYDESDGLESHEFNGGTQPAGWKDYLGRLWFPTTKGIAAIDPDEIPTNELPPQVLVEEVHVNDEAVPLHGDLVLSPGQDRFQFDYVGLSYLAPEKVQYRYMLVGYDDDWVSAGTRREAFYMNLPPGHYTFRVIAANNDGVWSDQAASVQFYLKPFFYQTPWFFLLSALSVLLLGLGVYRLRVRHLKARQKELEHLVETRTRDLREEKEKTEDALQEAERQREIAEEAKEVIEDQADRLREMDRIKTRFFNNISHEFRTPLTLTIGPLENALTGTYGPVDGVLKKQLGIMLRNSRRLLRLINQLLDLSKLESGRMELKIRRGDLSQLVEGVVLSFTAFAEKKNLTIRYEAEQDELRALFDPESLEKVFFNLLSNAIKFTPEGGRIWVRVRGGRTLPEASSGGEAVEIRVRDSGPGIPEGELAHIFDRFHQVDGTVSQVQEGTGIGLSLVKELVELHGGKIEVTSELGAGTEFVVLLPLRPPQADEAEIEEGHISQEVARGPMVEMAVFDDEEPAATGDGLPSEEEDDRPTLLVVDDNPDIRSYMVGCLSGTYRVLTAHDGVDALEQAQRLQPDLIISDLMMPRMDGYELCRALRKDERLNHVPFVMLTAKASLDDKLEGLTAGADDYIAKPFNARELRARVHNLLSLREQQSTLKDLNTELRQANDALSEASELKSQLLNIAAHDLKNPLNAVREFAKILKEELEDEAHVGEILDMVRDSADQMLHLVTQLLDSAALENGKLALQKEPVNLCALAKLVVDRNRNQAEGKGQQLLLSCEAEESASLVEADKNRLREAMDNLVNNAIKYSPLGKQVWITVRSTESGLRFEVRDEGPGLSDEDQRKLFRKFQRLSAVPTGGESSTGLGLSIVKQIVEMHGGRVWAESEEDQGSTFTIELTPIPQPTLS